MALKPYEEIAGEPLALPINGKIYTVTEPGLTLGLKLTAILTGEDKSLEEKPSHELWKLVLGPLWDEMLADNVPTQAATRAGMAALADFQEGREVAERIWESGIDPEALAAAAAAQIQQASTESNSTGEDSETPSPVSTSGTSSPKGTPRRAAKAKAVTSVGPTSSDSGI